MLNKCNICDNNLNESLYDGIVKCKNCGHIFCSLNLSEDEFKKIYSKNYFFGEVYNNYPADKRILQKNFGLRLKVLEKFLNPNRHKRLLEIGCAYGFFLDLAKDKFEFAEGIDITEDGTHYAKRELGLNVINGDFLKHDFKNQEFDIVCMWDTIEHLHNPNLYLEKISKHMKSGGLLAITTGDIKSFNARIKKDKWRLLHPPVHMHYFSQKTLADILDRYGFNILYNHYCGFFRRLDFIAYRIFASNKKLEWIYNLLHKSKIINIDLYLNLYDIMYVIARKR